MSHIWSVFVGLLVLILLGAVVFAAVEPAFLGDSIYFAFITALTVGYGDLVPTTAIGKLIAILTALLGWVLFGTMAGVSTRTVMLVMHPDQFDR